MPPNNSFERLDETPPLCGVLVVHFWPFPPLDFGFWAMTNVPAVAKHIRHRDSVVLTARVGGKLVGFAIMRFADETAHLNLLAIEPTYERLGIGRRLVEWLEETAVTAGTFVIALEVRAANVGARWFYRRLGYREDCCIAGYYCRVENAVRMVRDLRVVCGKNAT